LLARRVLLRFGFQPVDLFPDRIPLTDDAPAQPDIRAVAVVVSGWRPLAEDRTAFL